MKDNHLARIFRNRAIQYGNKEVFRYKEGDKYASVSWNSFIEQADLLSCFLLAEGIDKAANIGIYSPNHPEWTIADLAILSVGGVVVPMYSTSTFEQIKYIIDETQMSILFVGCEDQLKHAQKALDACESLQKLVTFNCTIPDDDRIVALCDLLNQSYPSNPKKELKQRLEVLNEDDLATIIYTSGTTGEPKGVMLDHHNFIHSFKIHDDRLDLGEQDVSLCFLPLSHVFERAWTYYVLYSGAVNVYNSNPKEIMEVLPLAKPTVMCAVPRFFEKIYEGIQNTTEKWPKTKKAIFDWALATGLQYIEYQKDAKKPPLSLAVKRSAANLLVMKKLRNVFGGHIKYMPCAGAALDKNLLRFFHAMGLMINYGYGATETTATVSCMKKDTWDYEFTGDIMPETQVKISDENMILVKGGTVFKGYYNKPEATAEVLKDGWYYTGDQGSIPVPGKLLMTERIKDIIKTSTGKYISPQKIELLLSQSELVEQLCVIGDNRKFLTALIVPVFSKLKVLAKENGLEINDLKTLVNHPKVINLFYHNIIALQTHLPPHEKVVKFTLLEEHFTIDNWMLTNSLKVRRKQVNKVYRDTIEKMY